MRGGSQSWRGQEVFEYAHVFFSVFFYLNETSLLKICVYINDDVELGRARGADAGCDARCQLAAARSSGRGCLS